MIDLDQQTPTELELALVARFVARRKERKITQAALARKSGVSLGSLKRFEQTGQISFDSLVKLAFALGYENDFSALFAKRAYSSIREVIDHAR